MLRSMVIVQTPTVIAYSRGTSTQVQKQKFAVTEYCKKNSLTLINIFSDVDWSSTTSHRPGLSSMLNFLRMEHVDSVIVTEGHILTTVPLHAMELLDAFRKKNIDLLFTEHGTGFQHHWCMVLTSMEFLTNKCHWFTD